MKKYLNLLFVAIFATMAFTFVACGDDDDEPEINEPTESTSNFVGTWEMSTSGILGDGDGDAYLQIASDNTFILVNDYGHDVKVSYGTWSNTDNTFTLNYKIFQGQKPLVPSVTYMIVSTNSKSFVLSLATQKFTFTKVSDSIMNKYEDDIDNVMNGNGENTSSFTLNGTTISNILGSSAEGNTFTCNFWYDDFVFAFEYRYSGKISNLTSGQNITDKIDIRLCEMLNQIIIDGSYEIISGYVRVDSKTSDSITLSYSNLKIQQYVGLSEGKVFTFNGKIKYSL